MRPEVKAAVMTRFDLVVMGMAKFAWRMMRIFDPKPLQTHFTQRPSERYETIEKCFSLRGDDATQNIARQSNCHIGSSTGRGRTGLVGRKGLVKIYNADNGKFLMIRAQGFMPRSGEKGIPKDGIALNYDAKKALGIPKNQEDGLRLYVGPANVADQEYFHMYQDPDASSRTARALSWYILIAGVVYTGFQLVLGLLKVAVLVLL